MQKVKFSEILPPWGHAPVPVLPSALRGYWAEEPLPVWACEELRLPVRSTFNSLGREVWETGVDRISKPLQAMVGRAVAAGNMEIRDLLACPDGISEGVDLESLPLRTRTRNLVRKMGWAEDPSVLTGMTVGQVLSVAGMGAVSLLDLLCLLEAAQELSIGGAPTSTAAWGSSDETKPATPPKGLAGFEQGLLNVPACTIRAWGQRGTPLLPRSLRRVLASEKMPIKICQRLGLATGTRFEVLSDEGWDSELVSVPTEALDLFAQVVNGSGIAKAMPPFQIGVPPTSVLLGLPLSTRARNVLGRMAGEGRDLRLWLSSIARFSDLLNIKGTGIKTALEIVCVVEAASLERERISALTEYAIESGEADRIRKRLLEVIDTDWSHQISGADPRFGAICPDGSETVFEQVDRLTRDGDGELMDEFVLATSIPAIEAEVQRIEALRLEEALEDLLDRIRFHDEPWRSGLLARFGWNGAAPLTLEETGALIGVTRERVRQVASQVLSRLPEHEVFLPALDRALRILEEHAPISLEGASRLLESSGVTARPFSPVAVISVAKMMGRDLTVRVKSTREALFIESETSGATAGSIVDAAKQIARRSGVVNLEYLISTLDGCEASIDPIVSREVLRSCLGARFCGDEWFWLPREKQNLVRKVTRKVLSVVSTIELRSLRDALVRFARYCVSSRGWSHVSVPPREVLRQFLDQHPEFRLTHDGRVEPHTPIATEEVLSANERLIVESLRQSPTGFMLRADLHRACEKRGVNPHTLDTYLSYHPCFQHVAENHWAVRGSIVDPAVLAASVAASGNVERVRRGLGFGWSSDGRLWVAARLPDSLHRYTFPIPAVIQRYVAGREFAAFDRFGVRCGELKMADYGALRGLGSFLARSGADGDDILFVSFGVADATATVWLGTDDELEQLDPSR